MSEIIRITGFDYPGLEAYAHLTERELFHPQKGDGSFIAESPNVINRALDAGFEPISLLMEEKQLKGQGKEVIARCGDVPVYVSTLDTLKKLTGFALTRGVLCAMRRKPLPKVEDICRSARRIAILENVMNPTNIGAVFQIALTSGRKKEYRSFIPWDFRRLRWHYGMILSQWTIHGLQRSIN